MNQDILKSYPDNYFDSIVTDPPYGIEFLGKDWDSNTGAIETWEQCYRVLKPGGHMLAFSAARTYHHLATNIESVGFEIRDQLMWIYASGFPKAQDIGKAIDKRNNKGKDQTVKADYNSNRDGVSVDLTINGVRCPVCKKDSNARYSCDKGQECGMIYKAQSPEAQQWSGWKTALKPAHEPIVMARKPFKGSCLDNVLKHGTGALNIDATRINIPEDDETHATLSKYKHRLHKSDFGNETNGFGAGGLAGTEKDYYHSEGRFPSNVFGEIPDYQKYFYCPKVSRAERHIGFETNNIATGNNFGDGLATGVDIMTKAKGSLDHIATSKGGMLGTDGEWAPEHWHGNKGNKNKGSLDHIPNTREMLEQIGGYYCDKDGNATTPDQHTNLAYVPGKGIIQAHGVTNAYEQLTPNSSVGNNHPTVKPVALMSYLVKLVTPEGGKVLDPFNGSGSTGMACVEHGFDYTGCELDPAYVEIATKRINGWYNKTLPDNNFNELFEGEK